MSPPSKSKMNQYISIVRGGLRSRVLPNLRFLLTMIFHTRVVMTRCLRGIDDGQGGGVQILFNRVGCSKKGMDRVEYYVNW